MALDRYISRGDAGALAPANALGVAAGPRGWPGKALAIVGDLATGIGALVLSALAIGVAKRSWIVAEYLLLVIPAVAFPVAAAWRARRGRVPAWATVLAVDAPFAVGIILLEAMFRAPVALAPTALLVFAASGLAAHWSRPAEGDRARRRARWRVAAVTAGAATLVAALLPATVGHLLTRTAASAAPQVTLRLLDGSELTTRSLAGKVVVLSFWATWCGPCKLELPELEAVAREHRGESDVMFVAVSSLHDDRREDVEAFVAKLGLTVPVAFQPDGAAARALGADILPTTVVIDREGTIRYRRFGYSVAAGFGAWLGGVLAELSRGPAGGS